MFKFDHIGIKVSNTDEFKDFYCNTLNCQPISSYKNDLMELTFLKSQDTVIELVNKFKETPSKSGAVDHLAFKVDNMEDAINYLKEKKIKFLSEKPSNIDGKIIFFFQGPAGEKMELVQEV